MYLMFVIMFNVIMPIGVELRDQWPHTCILHPMNFVWNCNANLIYIEIKYWWKIITGTCFIQKIYAPSSSLLQGKHLPFSPSPLRLNIFPLFVILSLTQLYRYTAEIFLFTTATFKYTYRAPLRRIGQEYQRT
jgi:hypothetical protein